MAGHNFTEAKPPISEKSKTQLLRGWTKYQNMLLLLLLQ